MRAHTMGRRLGRVVAVAALGFGLSLAGGVAHAGATAESGSPVSDGGQQLDVVLAAGPDLRDSGRVTVLRDLEWV